METPARYDGTRIGLALSDQGRTRRWLAGKLGVSEGYVSRVIKGERTMPEPMARRVSELIGVAFVLLFDLCAGSVALPAEETEAIPA
jgi:DNA-binding transcriptional regulator YdaS (Cro superfamily)